MGSQNSSPQTMTEFVSLDNFYHQSGTHGNIYESRLSNSSANRSLIHKSISFTDSSETVSRYLAM